MNNLLRLRLINHRNKEFPERIMDAVVVTTGESIKVCWWRLASDYRILLDETTGNAIKPEQYPLMIIDNHEEGD